jgi:hypothetical protein
VWRFKWQHPRFRGKTADDVRAATLDFADAQLVIARDYGFENWADLAAFAVDVTREGPIATFENAVEAIVAGDAPTLRQMLSERPSLIHARSARRHHATLLHYIAANGVEDARQKTPANAVEIARILLDAGAEVDALADMYDAKCTTMSMLVSSDHPAKAGLQVARLWRGTQWAGIELAVDASHGAGVRFPRHRRGARASRCAPRQSSRGGGTRPCRGFGPTPPGSG